MKEIITFGSASKDIFLKTKGAKVLQEKRLFSHAGICFNLGSKVDVDEIHFSSGGGGTNTAATFQKQGFKTSYCGMVGDDLAGKEIISELEGFGIRTDLMSQTNEASTNHSIVFSSGNSDRTIMVYRGASDKISKNNLPFERLKADLFYLAPLSGKMKEIFGDIINHARKIGAKVALNPGASQLKMPRQKLLPLLKHVDFLFLNQEEASMLTGIEYAKEEEIFQKLDELCDGICVMTKGSEGAVASDNYSLFIAPILKSKVIDRTGAGDSFNAGFVSGFLASDGDIKHSIQLATANAASCLGGWGAKYGLLEENKDFKKVKIEKQECCAGEICLCGAKK